MWFRVQGSGHGVWGVGLVGAVPLGLLPRRAVQGLGFRVQGWGLGFEVWGLGVMF